MDLFIRKVLLLLPSAFMLTIQPSSAQTYIQPPEYQAIDRNGVDLLSGSASLTIKGGSIGSGDGAITYDDYWSSGLAFNSINNILALSYDDKHDSYSASVGFENSSREFRQVNGGGAWLMVRGTGETLTEAPDEVTFVHTLRNGEVRTYGLPPGQTYPSFSVLLSRTLPNGVTWNYTWQTYSTLARPTSAINNLGYKIVLGYASDANPNLNDDNAVRNWLFVSSASFYNLAASTSPIFSISRANLSGVTQVVTDGGQIWNVSGSTYTMYGAPANPFYVKTPSASSTNYTYTPVYSGSTSAVANGATYRYVFNVSVGSTTGQTTVTDPLGGVANVYYNIYPGKFGLARFPYQVNDANGNVTTYTVVSGYEVTSVTRPEGDKDVYTYDLRGNSTQVSHNPKPNSSLASTTETAVYPSSCNNVLTCNKPTSVTNRNGQTTQYSYDSQHGGVLSETLPAVNGINPVKRYSYVQRYAWILDLSGNYVHAGPPVWLESEMRTCMSTATNGSACAGGSADEIVTAYEYGADAGPNNLVLRGISITSTGVTLRTCYAYDARGNKISETKPLGTGGNCS